ncbi:hypothetical protein EU800_23140 [Tropicimonas sp. IMCC6043]|nr:hypothetical protein EU800_23140 [Tropicimonas sp. IMCC6043]
MFDNAGCEPPQPKIKNNFKDLKSASADQVFDVVFYINAISTFGESSGRLGASVKKGGERPFDDVPMPLCQGFPEQAQAAGGQSLHSFLLRCYGAHLVEPRHECIDER